MKLGHHLICILVASTSLQLNASAFPPLYFHDSEGNELGLFRSEDYPHATIRLPSPHRTEFISGPLSGEQGHLIVTMNIAEDVTPKEHGVRVHLRHDPELTNMYVTSELYGEQPQSVNIPTASGTFRRVQTPERLQAAREEAAQTDKMLEASIDEYTKAPSTHSALKKLLATHSEWIASRPSLAEATVRFSFGLPGDDAPEELPEFWQAWADETRSRNFLLLAASGVKAPAGRSGKYIDGHGGMLELKMISSNAAEHLDFAIFVVRGPTAHTGQIEGQARFEDSNTAVFVDQDPSAIMGEQPARLAFKFDDHTVEVSGENTGYYHGARAYFDGIYYRLPAEE